MKCLIAIVAVLMLGQFTQQSSGQYFQIDRGCPSQAQSSCGCSECASNCKSRLSGLFDQFMFYPNADPPPSHAMPFGTLVNATLDTQINNGIQAQMVFYHFDFIQSAGYPVQLSPLGIQHLHKMARISQMSTYYMNTGPIVVQTTGIQAIDESRRQAVVDAIAASGAPFSAEQIVFGQPPVRGLSGTETEKIYKDFLDPSRFKATRIDSSGANATNSGSGTNSSGN